MAANLSACGPCRFQSLDHETRILGIHFPIHGSLWIRHLIYMFSQAFLIKIIIGSFPAYDILSEHAEITEI